MKICIVAQTFAPQPEGGAEISSRHAAKNLSANHEVVVLALGLAGSPGAEPGECQTDAPYRLHRLPFRNSYLPEAKRPAVGAFQKALWHGRNAIGAVAAADLRAFFQKEKFDLIYAQNCTKFQPALYDVAAELGIPVCQHLRDYALLCPRASMYKDNANCTKPCLSCSLLTMRARAASDTVKSVIAVSDFVRQRYLQHGLFRNAEFHVLHNTNTSVVDFDESLLASRPEPTDVFTFGYLGALSAEKGLEVLIDAFLHLPENLNVRLLLAGTGHDDFVHAMKARLAHLPETRVKWLGHVKPEIVFGLSEVIVVPSLWHEPQSRVLIEAGTYGVPVFAARTGGSPEVVEGYGIGKCYSADSSEQLRDLLANAANAGVKTWRSSLLREFPALDKFRGTSEDTKYYEKLIGIIECCAE